MSKTELVSSKDVNSTDCFAIRTLNLSCVKQMQDLVTLDLLHHDEVLWVLRVVARRGFFFFSWSTVANKALWFLRRCSSTGGFFEVASFISRFFYPKTGSWDWNPMPGRIGIKREIQLSQTPNITRRKLLFPIPCLCPIFSIVQPLIVVLSRLKTSLQNAEKTIHHDKIHLSQWHAVETVKAHLYSHRGKNTPWMLLSDLRLF